MIQACQALATKKTPTPPDADEAFGVFVSQRLKAMTEPRKTKCISEIMQALLSNNVSEAQVQVIIYKLLGIERNTDCHLTASL